MSPAGRPLASGAAPTVSVVVPTRDREAWLREAVGSVLGQTFGDLELVVVDDGSADGTADYLAAVDDPRLRVVRRHRSGGVARARNAGAAVARGRFLAFLDSDDLWRPRKLEVQVEATRGSGATWSYTRYEHVDEAGRPVAARAGAWRPLSGSIAPALVAAEASVSIVTVLVRRAAFEELGGFDETPDIREDLELLVRLAMASDALAVSEPLALVRDHAGRSTRGYRGAEPYLTSARTYEVLLPRLGRGELRAIARRRRGRLLAEAAAVELAAGSPRRAATLLAAAVGSGASPLGCASAVRRGLGLDRALLRRLARPLLGRETRVWRLLPWPRLRLACFGDPVDCLVHALLLSRRPVTFVQIGSNDGVRNDPLWTFRRYGNWRGLLVEPWEPAFRRLRRNYAPWRDRFRFENAAVAAERGRRPFYRLIDGSGQPADDQVGSLHPDRLRRRAGGPDPAPAGTVACLRLEDLWEKHAIRPDLVHVDAEGGDAEIVDQLELERHPPAVILYEHLHLGLAERRRTRARLERAGYSLAELEADTIAVLDAALDAHRALRSAWRLVAAAPASPDLTPAGTPEDAVGASPFAPPSRTSP